MSSENSNFIRISRKFLHCGECGRPFNTDHLKPHVLVCGHNVCELCMNSQRLSAGPQCCMVCSQFQDKPAAPVSHDLLGIVFGKEQTMKRIPLRYRCAGCAALHKEQELTVCRTCSGWHEGTQSAEATDFAKRPISSLLCRVCSVSGHHNHNLMSWEIIDRIWNTPIATELIETRLGTAEKLLDLLRGGAITQINQLTDRFSDSLDELKNKVSTGQFPLESTVHITNAVDIISYQIRRWNQGIQKSSEDAQILLKYFEKLVVHVRDAPQRSGKGIWEMPPPNAEERGFNNVKDVVQRNIEALEKALPMTLEEPLPAESPEPMEDEQHTLDNNATGDSIDSIAPIAQIAPVAEIEPVAQVAPVASIAPIATIEQTLPRKRVHAQAGSSTTFFTEDDYDRPRRMNSKKNYAIDDDLEVETPKKRGRRKTEHMHVMDHGMTNGHVHRDLSPYNMDGTHLANDPILNQGMPSPIVKTVARRGGRGRRRGMRGGRGRRGSSRPVISTPIVHQVDTEDDDDPSDAYDPDMNEHTEQTVTSLEDDQDTHSQQSQQSPAEQSHNLVRSVDEIFQELTGMRSASGSTSGAVSVSGSSGVGGQPGDGQGPSPPPLSQSSSPPLVTQPSTSFMSLDFLEQTNRDMMRSPYGDGFSKKQRPWEEVTQAARYGTGPVPDYYTTAPINHHVQSTFINNTPPY